MNNAKPDDQREPTKTAIPKKSGWGKVITLWVAIPTPFLMLLGFQLSKAITKANENAKRESELQEKNKRNAEEKKELKRKSELEKWGNGPLGPKPSQLPKVWSPPVKFEFSPASPPERCPGCQQRFEDFSVLSKHEENCEAYKRLPQKPHELTGLGCCPGCQQRFEGFLALLEHERTCEAYKRLDHGSQSKLFDALRNLGCCPGCQQRFENTPALSKHEETCEAYKRLDRLSPAQRLDALLDASHQEQDIVKKLCSLVASIDWWPLQLSPAFRAVQSAARARLSPPKPEPKPPSPPPPPSPEPPPGDKKDGR